MRKQITLTPQHEDIIKRLSKYLDLSQSAIINYAIWLLVCAFNELPERKFFERINDYYFHRYIKDLPRGKRAKKRVNDLVK